VDFIRQLRIDRARELLENTWMRIGEIGEIVGYPNANYFARVFREATGMLPSEYRKPADPGG
jgi:two-component system response regulator YesN